MDEFAKFADFRVSAWVDQNGLIERLARPVEAFLRQATGYAGAAAAVCAAACVAATPAHADGMNVAWPNQKLKAMEQKLALESAEDRVARLDAALGASIERFMDMDHSDIDPRTLAAAERFLQAVPMPSRRG